MTTFEIAFGGIRGLNSTSTIQSLKSCEFRIREWILKEYLVVKLKVNQAAAPTMRGLKRSSPHRSNSEGAGPPPPKILVIYHMKKVFYIYTHTYIYTHIHTYACFYICIYIYVYTHMYIYIHMQRQLPFGHPQKFFEVGASEIRD